MLSPGAADKEPPAGDQLAKNDFGRRGKMKPLFSKYYLYPIIFIAAPLLLLLVYALRGLPLRARLGPGA